MVFENVYVFFYKFPSKNLNRQSVCLTLIQFVKLCLCEAWSLLTLLFCKMVHNGPFSWLRLVCYVQTRLLQTLVIKTIRSNYPEVFDKKSVSFLQTLHKKWNFPLRISPVNVTKSVVFANLVTFNGEILTGRFFVQWNILQSS